MKVIVSGTRHGVDNLVIKTMFDFVNNYNNKPKLLIHGACKGVDTQSEYYCSKLGWKIKSFKPDWSIGKHAGLLRNSDMIKEDPDFGVFIPGPKSKGTYDCLNKFLLLNKPYIIYNYETRTFNLIEPNFPIK